MISRAKPTFAFDNLSVCDYAHKLPIQDLITYAMVRALQLSKLYSVPGNYVQALNCL